MWAMYARGPGEYDVLEIEPGYGIEYQVEGRDLVSDDCCEVKRRHKYTTRAAAENALLFFTGKLSVAQFLGK